MLVSGPCLIVFGVRTFKGRQEFGAKKQKQKQKKIIESAAGTVGKKFCSWIMIEEVSEASHILWCQAARTWQNETYRANTTRFMVGGNPTNPARWGNVCACSCRWVWTWAYQAAGGSMGKICKPELLAHQYCTVVSEWTRKLEEGEEENNRVDSLASWGREQSLPQGFRTLDRCTLQIPDQQ